MFHMQAKEITELGASDQYGDAVGESNDDRAGKIFDHGAESGDAHEDQENAGEHRAGEESGDAVTRNYSKDNDYEGSGRASDLRAGAAQRRNQETSDNGAVDACLRRDARGDGEGHSQGEGDQAYGDAREQVGGEFLGSVVTEK